MPKKPVAMPLSRPPLERMQRIHQALHAGGCPNASRLTAIMTAFALIVLGMAIAATTKVETALGMTCWENTTFKFMISTVPNDAVDFTGQRFWFNAWPGGVKCIAGFNVPLPGQQITFHLLRWSWSG